MEIKDIRKVQDEINEEINFIGQSPDKEKLATERSIPIIKQEIDIIMLKTIENLYYLIVSKNLSIFYQNHIDNFREIKNIEDYQFNLNQIKKKTGELTLNLDDLSVSKAKMGIAIKYTKTRESFARFLQDITMFVDQAVYLSQMEKVKSDTAYIRLVAKTLPSMKKALLKMQEDSLFLVEYQQYLKDESIENYHKIIEFFDESADLISKFADEYMREIKEDKKAKSEMATSKVDVSKIVKSQTNTQTNSRLRLIKEANDKYEEFCLDFMRDLEKQYALSSKDLYENFVNVKFKKFVKRYPMPVPDSASEGYAREVIYQIQKLMNIVSEISVNSYVTAMYK